MGRFTPCSTRNLWIETKDRDQTCLFPDRVDEDLSVESALSWVSWSGLGALPLQELFFYLLIYGIQWIELESVTKQGLRAGRIYMDFEWKKEEICSNKARGERARLPQDRSSSEVWISHLSSMHLFSLSIMRKKSQFIGGKYSKTCDLIHLNHRVRYGCPEWKVML